MKILNPLRTFLFLAAALALPSGAASLYVAPQGNDANSGTEAKPYKTIAKAIAQAKAGDTIHLAKAVYQESAEFKKRSGEPNQPIILEGHGATLDGSDELDLAKWQQIKPGLYRHDHLLPFSDAWVGRYYFIFDGQMNRMGRISKGKTAAFKAVDKLAENEWTFVKEEKAFYLRVKPGTKVRAPLRSNGVGFSGDCRHITIRDLTCTHVWNDGFNIHGLSRAVRFENVRAVECGDDGISAHEDCEIFVDGFESTGNATGMCHIQGARSTNERVNIHDCIGFDIFMIGTGIHVVNNSTVRSSAQNVVVARGDKGTNQPCELRLSKVAIKRAETSPGEIRGESGSILELDNVTASNLNLVGKGYRVKAVNCRFTGSPKPTVKLDQATVWAGDHNQYDLQSFQAGDRTYTSATFDEFRKTNKSDAASVW